MSKTDSNRRWISRLKAAGTGDYTDQVALLLVAVRTDWLKRGRRW